jgi:hypothetical protein
MPSTDTPKISDKAAIEQVLSDGKARKAKEIIDAALAIATDLKGGTPKATLSAMLAMEANRDGGCWVRTAPGTYGRRPARPRP